MKKPKYTIESIERGTAREAMMSDGPGVERWIIREPLTPDQCARIVEMLAAAYHAGRIDARGEIQDVLGIVGRL